jgi:hypothetical protein
MPGYQDLLSGFSERKAEVEKQNYDRSIAASEQEQKIFSTLLGSDDPQIQQLAMTGLLDSANPKKRKGGLRGWLGELEQSPHLAVMQALINTPVTEQRQINLPGEAKGLAGPPEGLQTVKPTIPQTPGPNPAAMPATSLVDQKVDAGPPTPQTYTQPPPIPYSVQHPRQVFLPPEERKFRDEMGQVSAEVEGDKMRVAAGLAPRYGVRQGAAGASATGSTYAEGNIVPDPDSPTGFSQDLYLRSDPTKRQRIPAQDPTKSTTRFFGQDLESISREPAFGGKPYAAQDPATQARINAEKQTRETQQAGATTTARGQANADVPLTTQQRYQAINGMQDDWRKVEAPHREIQRQYALMQTGLQRFNQGDKIGGSQAVLVTFQKILDPTSVVRESEYARTPEGLGLLERMRGSLERLTSGGAGVPAAELAAMVETARQVVQGMTTWNAAERQRIEATAQQFKIDPALITGRPTAAPPAPTTPAQTTTPGTTAAAAGGPPAPSGSAPAVGDTVMYKGKRYKVAGVTNGQADLELIP